MSDIILSGKREFDYDDEEKFFLTLMRIIFVVSALLFAWGVYSHWRQIDLIKTGQSAVGTVSRDGRHVSYTTGDGRSYSVNITGMLLDELEETVTVYYKENPAEAVPPTSIKFFLAIYGIAVLGMILSLFFIRHAKVWRKMNLFHKTIIISFLRRVSNLVNIKVSRDFHKNPFIEI